MRAVVWDWTRQPCAHDEPTKPPLRTRLLHHRGHQPGMEVLGLRPVSPGGHPHGTLLGPAAPRSTLTAPRIAGERSSSPRGGVVGPAGQQQTPGVMVSSKCAGGSAFEAPTCTDLRGRPTISTASDVSIQPRGSGLKNKKRQNNDKYEMVSCCQCSTADAL